MDELALKLSELADKFGPATVELARNAAMTNGLSNMLLYIAGFMFWGSVLIFAVWFATKYVDNDRFIKNSRDLTGLAAMAMFLLSIFAAIGFFLCLIEVLAPWNWIAIINPDLAIAKKVLGL